MPPSLRWVPAVRFPRLLGTMRHSDALPLAPPPFVFLPVAVPLSCVRCSLRTRSDATACSLGLGHPDSRPGFRVETTGPPTFLENPCVCLRPALRPRRVRLVRPCDEIDAAAVRLTTTTPAMWCFRGSITRPQHSLSYASPTGLPRPTPDSLPAAGPALRGGIETRWVPVKGFQR